MVSPVRPSAGDAGDAAVGSTENLLALLPGVDPDPPAKRELCPTCRLFSKRCGQLSRAFRRPPQVCWCPFLPAGGVAVKSTVYILQHPFEGVHSFTDLSYQLQPKWPYCKDSLGESRCLSTTPILYHCLPEGHRQILRGPRYNLRQHPDLAEALSQSSTILLYPAPDAVPINDIARGVYNLVVLDGTWMQARGVYAKNPFLHSLKKVKLVSTPLSQYVIRTQPTNDCLSTLESVAAALETLEGIPGLYDVMTQPLRALCSYQLAHGAVVHQSKQYLIEKGLYKGQQHRLKAKRSPKTAQLPTSNKRTPAAPTDDPPPCDVYTQQF